MGALSGLPSRLNQLSWDWLAGAWRKARMPFIEVVHEGPPTSEFATRDGSPVTTPLAASNGRARSSPSSIFRSQPPPAGFGAYTAGEWRVSNSGRRILPSRDASTALDKVP